MVILVSEFGQDHWTTLMYLETRCVDHGGKVERRHMRCDASRHPGLAHSGSGKTDKYMMILKGGVEITDHDDWDCVDDLEKSGFLVQEGTGINPVIRLTDLGWETTGRLRRRRAGGKSVRDFEV